jgi:DNA-binding SARP family transcriptional activator
VSAPNFPSTSSHELISLYNEGTIDAARRGVALYAGEYCSGDVADWMYPMRALSACAYASMLERLAESAWTAADYMSALDYGFKLVGADRGNEAATRLVMRAFSKSGRPTKAIESYQALRQWLKDHLGVAPSAETESLRMLIAET